MKIQLAYKFTGEDKEKLLEIIKKIKETLESKGKEVYIPVLDKNLPNDKKGIYIGTLKKIPNCDILIALILSKEKSEGLLMEVGHALGLGKKVILMINKGIKDTHLRELCDTVIEFEDINEIYEKLKPL
ncbi:MAG: nucleoside 2-deoxyribosyltransferase [Candidatus Nanoarchaeia archaeon]